MPHRVLESYQPYFGEGNADLLSKPEAKSFCISTSKLAYTIYNGLSEYLGEGAEINIHLLSVAVSSAYLDIRCSLNLHEAKGGPSNKKKAAAVACWINRIKPIQISAKSEREGFAYLNSHLSLLISIAILYGENVGNLSEIAAENKKWNHLMYVFMWRNPSYRELTTIFELI